METKNTNEVNYKVMWLTLGGSILAFWFMARVGMLCSGSNWLTQIFSALKNVIPDIIKNPFRLDFNMPALILGLVGFVAVWLAYLLSVNKFKADKPGIEHGSSRWATKKEMSLFMNNSVADTNLVFSDNSGLAVQLDKSLPEKVYRAHERNLNVAVIGGSGSGKTRFYVKPNLMQCHGNYFVTDPKGTCIEEVGHLMEKEGYEIKMFNVIPAIRTIDADGNEIPKSERKNEMDKSLTYNPLYYVHSVEQIQAFVNCLIKNTTNEKKNGGDQFWENSERLLYMSIISFMLDWIPREQFTLPKMVEILQMAKASESNENFESGLDLTFQEVKTGYCYGSLEKDDAGIYRDEATRRYLETTGQIGTKTITRKVGNVPTEVGIKMDTYTMMKANQEEGIGLKSRKLNPQQQEVQGCGKLTPKAGYIDIPTPMQNNSTGECLFLEWEKAYKEKGPDAAQGVLDAWDHAKDFCCVKYKQFKSAAGETLKSIIISCNSRLTPIDVPAVKRILEGKRDENGEPTGECEMELDALGDPGRKICTFAIMSDTNDSLFFLVSLMMYQAFDSLCNKALTDYGGKLPSFVHFILDEFANLGVLPDFKRTIAITRSRNIGVSMILQTPFQLKGNYDENDAHIIIDNCDTMVYLGGGSDGADKSTCKEISARLGKETIKSQLYNTSKGSNWSTNEQNSIMARELMMSDEVARLPRGEELVMIKNTYPFRDYKFQLEKPERYAYIDPQGHNPSYPCKVEKNFDFEEYQDRRKEKERAERQKRISKRFKGRIGSMSGMQSKTSSGLDVFEQNSTVAWQKKELDRLLNNDMPEELKWLGQIYIFDNNHRGLSDLYERYENERSAA